MFGAVVAEDVDETEEIEGTLEWCGTFIGCKNNGLECVVLYVFVELTFDVMLSPVWFGLKRLCGFDLVFVPGGVILDPVFESM